MKEGYKQTEIGVIPEDWEVALFGEKSKIYRGGSPRPIQDYLTEADNGVNWIKIGDVSPDGKYITKTEERIRPEGISKSREVHSGDFILSNSMSFGRPYILSIDGCIHDGWLAIQDYRETFSTEFLYYLLSSESVYKQQVAMAAGSSVKNLNKEKVSALLVCFPREKAEQHRIAEALSDMDDLIASLEKLIAKKKAIKQGAMQELLTGKRRLPGFSGEWTRQAMGGYADFIVGYPFSSTHFNEKAIGLRLIRNRDLKSDDQIIYSSEKVNPAYIVENGDVLVGMDGDFLPCIWKKGRALLNQRVGKLLFSTSLNNRFAYYAFQKPLSELQDGTGATTVKHLSHGDIKKLTVFMPPTKNEQEAVATVLSDIDEEIQLYEGHISKARQIKNGMMQQLLTGKIRLV